MSASHRGTESDFELGTIDRLIASDYDHLQGTELVRSHRDVVLTDRLLAFIRGRYPDVPDAAVEVAVARFSHPQGIDTLRRNLDFHQLVTRGWECPIEHADGTATFKHMYPINWDDPHANDFLVVNQLPIKGRNDRRPDIVIYVNGLPLVLFELKNPFEPNFTVQHALNQIGHYRHDIPQVFEFNALTAISDGITTLHGMWPSSMEWFAPWKSIDGVSVEANTTGSMKTLIDGLFRKDRLLAYIRDFIVFEQANDRIVKKGAKYHQFFAVRLALQRAKEAFLTEQDHRVGVIWHTTGSGKSLSMTFLIGILRRTSDFRNPTILVQVDANDLDDQLFDQLVAARALVGDTKHADRIDDLRQLLQTDGGELICSTIQKFQLLEGESEHPLLSERSNILVIADEAHRSQYGFEEGYARYLRDALPHAKFLGFTGTPVSFASADTVAVFGEIIHTYDILQSQIDKTTVPIFYEPRQARLHLSGADINAALSELGAGTAPDELERKKSKWAALAYAAGAKQRVADLAADLLAHYLDRISTLPGKALVVCMTRANCVKMYDALRALPNCPEIKVVITSNLAEDPEEWSQAGHTTTKGQRNATKQRMIDPDDPLAVTIVCDMWLTGTDIPCLHTLYIDKPMQGHSIIQAISRVNRVFGEKPHGLVVDYIGIGDELREATVRYSRGGGLGEPAPNIEEEGRPLFMKALAQVREVMPAGIEVGGWRSLSRIELEDRYALVYGLLTVEDDRRDQFLRAESTVSRAFILVKHLDSCRGYADEVIFYQRVRKQLLKTIPGSRPPVNLDLAVRDLIDDTVQSEGVVDIYKVAGMERPDLSILDDEFLQTFKDRPHQNLRLKLLQKLLGDEIRHHESKNLTQARTFREMLEATLRRYHNRLIDAAAVIQTMIEIRKQLDRQKRRAEELSITEEELAFYDAITENAGAAYTDAFLRELVHDVVQTVKHNLKVDWTAPHRDVVQAQVRTAVRLTLRKRGVQRGDLARFVTAVMDQAMVSFASWPLVA